MTICMTIVLSIILGLLSDDLSTWTYVFMFIGSGISMVICAILEYNYKARIRRLEHNQDWLKNKIDEMEGKK